MTRRQLLAKLLGVPNAGLKPRTVLLWKPRSVGISTSVRYMEPPALPVWAHKWLHEPSAAMRYHMRKTAV